MDIAKLLEAKINARHEILANIQDLNRRIYIAEGSGTGRIDMNHVEDSLELATQINAALEEYFTADARLDMEILKTFLVVMSL